MSYSEVHFGATTFVHREDVGDLDILYHAYERNGYDLPKSLVGVTFVDVGAHIGGVSVLAAQRGANVIAFEPSAQNAALCAENLRRNANGPFQVLQNGIGMSGERPLYLSPNNSGQHSEFLTDPYWDAGLKADVFELVSFMPLSVATVNLPSFHLKLDCEGSEIGIVEEILAGLHAKIPAIYIEFQVPEDYNFQLAALGRYYKITGLGSNEYNMEHL